MKKVLFLVVLLLLLGKSNAQCLQIESILVDACVPGGGCTSSTSPNCSCEGKNEMVLFKVGSTPLNVANLVITWPNNSFKGWRTPDAQTLANITTLNNTIIKCGNLVEPIAGVLPANSEVLIIGSVDMCPSANSFANLQDTIVVLFQDTGNFQGHFGNQNNGGISSVPTGTVALRTTILTYAPLGCADSATYDRRLLVNNLGTYGGSSSQNDGATVLFDAPGNATYVNIGCTAPYIPITADAGVDTNVCINSSLNINGTATGPFVSCTWSGGAGSFANASSASTAYTPGTGESGTIKLYFSAMGKCSLNVVKDSVTITINPLPIAAISSSLGNTICENQSTTFTGSGGTSYSWELPGNIAGPATSTLSATSQGTYTLTATNICASDTESFFLTVNPLPVVSVTPSGATTFCAGGSVDLTASGATSYTWTNPSSASNPVTVNATGFYWVTGTNSCGTDTAGVNVVVIQTPTVSASASSPVFCSGNNVTLTSSTQAGNTITWAPGGTDPANITTGGTYSVTATAPNSCGTATASVTVTMDSPMTLSIADSPNDTICQGNSATLTVSGGGTYSWSTGSALSSISTSTAGNFSVTSANACGTFSASTDITVMQTPTVSISSSNGTALCSGVSTTLMASGGDSYFWLPGATTGSTLTASSAGTYSVGSGNYCGSDTATITLSVTTTPIVTISASGPVSFCSGGSVDLTGGGASTYLWNNSSSSATITVSTPGFYWVTGTSSCGTDSAGITVSILPAPTVNLNQTSATVCNGDSILLVATTTGNPVLTWSPITSSNDSVYALTSGTYTVNATNSCGTSTANFALALDNPLNISISVSPNDTICQGNSATLTASGGSSYSWSTGSSSSTVTVSAGGNYSVTSTNVCGTYSATQNVTVIQTPSVSVAASGTNLCSGQTATLTATVTGSGNLVWSTGSSSNPITVNAAGNYSATVSNSCGSSASNAVVITTGTAPTASITPSATILCPGDSAMLTASGNGSYSWSTGSSATSIAVNNAGTYSLTVTNSCGTATTSVVITTSSVSAQFNATPASGIYPLPVSFTNTSINASSYAWDFGNGDTSSVAGPSEIYSAPGTYTVILSATNSNGCTDFQSATITVLEHESFVLIPNVFSPNGDSLNETLLISYSGITNFKLVIYDRWGLELFSSDSLGNSWDGKTSSGTKCSEGTYYYLVKAEGIDGKKMEVKGFVLLVR